MRFERHSLPASAYISQRFFEAEMSRVFPSSWVLAADLQEVASPGDFVTTVIGQEPVLVVRDTDGSLGAFSNVCPHRGSVIAVGAGNCKMAFKCPYHGWTFNTDGSLRGVPNRKGFDNQIKNDQLGLHSLRLGVWERFVFVNVDGSAPPLDSYLEDVPELLDQHGIKDLAAAVRIDDAIDVNWKLLVDNALDDYHLPEVHPNSLQPGLEGMKLQEYIGVRSTSILCMPLNKLGLEPYQIRANLRKEQSQSTYAIDVFPNLTIVALPDGGVSTLRFDPIDVRRTAIQFRSYSHSSQNNEVDDEAFLSTILKEDYEIVRRLQQGVLSQHFRPGPRHYLEGRLALFHASLIELLGEEPDLY